MLAKIGICPITNNDVIVDIDRIVFIASLPDQIGSGNTQTNIKLDDGTFFYTKEFPDEVFALIQKAKDVGN